MCSTPDIPVAQKYQQSQSPVYKDNASQPAGGRRSTMLTGGGGVETAAQSLKKTALGA